MPGLKCDYQSTLGLTEINILLSINQTSAKLLLLVFLLSAPTVIEQTSQDTLRFLRT